MCCLCFCMSQVISSFNSLRAGSQVFALLMLFLCVILHTMWSGRNLHLLCILPFGMLCLSATSMVSANIMLAVCVYVGLHDGLNEIGLCVFRELWPVSPPAVGEGPLQSCRLWYWLESGLTTVCVELSTMSACTMCLTPRCLLQCGAWHYS